MVLLEVEFTVNPVTLAAVDLGAIAITGFLGAGKTTLIRHMLEHAAGRRIALIINEFGDVAIDHLLQKRLQRDGLRGRSACRRPCHGGHKYDTQN